MNIPNFNLMNSNELMEFWRKYSRPSSKDAEELIGDRRDGYKKICETLASYACSKACAVKLRLDDKIERAKVYEKHCNIYYNKLPEEVRLYMYNITS